MTETKAESGKSSLAQVAPFAAPLFLFMLFLSGESYFPDQHYLLYPFKTILVALALAWYWRSLPSLTPTAPVLSLCVGIAGVVLWVGLDPVLVRYDQPLIGRNPFQLYPAGEAWALFGFRLAGISLCVPIMEELFWRGFLMRWLIQEDFESVPLGTYQPLSFWITTACFAAVHGAEWPLAVVVGIIYGVWFVRTKSLGNIMLAHGVTNFLLALYCLMTNDWHFLSIVMPGPSLK
jgi:CAAX prenyl protease-like protein